MSIRDRIRLLLFTSCKRSHEIHSGQSHSHCPKGGLYSSLSSTYYSSFILRALAVSSRVSQVISYCQYSAPSPPRHLTSHLQQFEFYMAPLDRRCGIFDGWIGWRVELLQPSSEYRVLLSAECRRSLWMDRMVR